MKIELTQAVTSNVSPNHYACHTVSPIDLIESYNLNFNLGNAIKYVARCREKNGDEDIIKAIWYLLNELNVPREEISKYTKHLEEKCRANQEIVSE